MDAVKKSILCYGDSNTYGYNPENGMRYPADVRYPGRLQILLGEDYQVIEEGCNGRTTIYDDPLEGWKNGLDYLKPCLNSHKPVDLVILMLGTNDLKEVFHLTALDIAKGAATLIEVIQKFTPEKQGYVPKILLVSPPEIGPGITSSPFYGSFYERAIEESKNFPEAYFEVAKKYNCDFLNAANYVKPSEKDSLHLSAKAHKTLAGELARICREII